MITDSLLRLWRYINLLLTYLLFILLHIGMDLVIAFRPTRPPPPSYGPGDIDPPSKNSF